MALPIIRTKKTRPLPLPSASTWRSFFRRLYRSRGIVLRALLCWGIGCLILLNDEVNSYDRRLQIRGDQNPNSEIALITLRSSDFSAPFGKEFGPLHEMIDITDSFYWDPHIWTDLLQKILADHPKKIGVTLYFNENLSHRLPKSTLKNVFMDPRIIWGTSVAISDRVNQPLFADALKSNVGSTLLLRDEDGVIRRFSPLGSDSLHMAEKMADLGVDSPFSRFINYQRAHRGFAEYSLQDVLQNQIPQNALRNKYVLIGAESLNSTLYLTPLGSSQKHQVIAQILDNVLEKRWISRGDDLVYIAALFLLMLLSVWLINTYPQSVAFVLMLCLGALIAALSAWVFDSFYIWIPVVSPAMQLAVTWMIFIGYQANKIERKNWLLRQEQKYLKELEQLKNNFVSLISHDLKTPIAKIQAILDRLAVRPEAQVFSEDLKSLSHSSEELNRYIQSILKVLRVESRDFQLNKEVGDINDVIQDAINQLIPLAQEKNISINAQLEPMFSIEVDLTLIREVMVNLIDNAIKYSPEGGQIQISSREAAQKVWVEVIDTGAGVPPDEVTHIWGKFVRGKDQDMKTKGTGLGLYLVKYFIELHNGEVYLESTLNKGTKVGFSLPLDLPTDEPEVSV